MKIIDLGEKSDCSELESKSEDESHPRTNVEPKVSVQEEIKEKGGVETESSLQPPMTKNVLLILLNKCLQFSKKLKKNKILN